MWTKLHVLIAGIIVMFPASAFAHCDPDTPVTESCKSVQIRMSVSVPREDLGEMDAIRRAIQEAVSNAVSDYQGFTVRFLNPPESPLDQLENPPPIAETPEGGGGAGGGVGGGAGGGRIDACTCFFVPLGGGFYHCECTQSGGIEVVPKPGGGVVVIP
jgi:hypothetical protein